MNGASPVPSRPKGLSARELLRATNAIKSGGEFWSLAFCSPRASERAGLPSLRVRLDSRVVLMCPANPVLIVVIPFCCAESPAAVLLALQARETATGRQVPPLRAGSAPTTSLERSPRSSRLPEASPVAPATTLSRRSTRDARVQARSGSSASQSSDAATATPAPLIDAESKKASEGVQRHVRDAHGSPEAVEQKVAYPRQRNIATTSAPLTDAEVVQAGDGTHTRVRDAHGSRGPVEKKLALPKLRNAVIPPLGDSDLPTQFGLVHASGIPRELEDQEKLKAFFCQFGAVQAVHLRQERVSSALWALVTFMDVPQAQAAIDAASELNAQHPGLVSVLCCLLMVESGRLADSLPFCPC